MTPSIELVVIINSFNRCRLLSEALPSVVNIIRQLSIGTSIVIFEAGSTDGSLEWIHQYISQNPDVPIHCLTPSAEADRSFSAGCNTAVEFASQHYSDLKYCFFFETDNLIANSAALPLAIQLLEQEQTLAAVGFTVEQCNQQKAGFGSRFPSVLSFVVGQQLSNRFGLEHMTISEWQDFQSTKWGISDIVYTSPLLVRYQSWQATGGMDAQNFPFSDCDNDWCWSIYERGWRVAVLDVTGVIHDNRTQVSSWSANRVIDFHRARFRLLLKHQGQTLVLLKPLLWLRHCIEAVLLIGKVCVSERARKSFKQRLMLLRTVLNSYELV
jgi:GT2 family glycosyltransferase